MLENISESPESITKRLDRLKQWRDEQQQLLIEKQKNQRKLLYLEQEKVYEKLGISNSKKEINTVYNGNYSKTSEQRINNLEKAQKKTEEDLNITNGQGKSVINGHKHPFLRRGQGLTSRFKVNPDTFRLHNLPKYKYANSHKKYFKAPQKLVSNGKSGETNAPSAKQVKLSEESRNSINCSLKQVNVNKTNDTEEEECGEMTISKIIKTSVASIESADKDQAFDVHEAISWADVLNPINIQPMKLKDFRSNSSVSKSVDEIDSLSIFELLEKRAQDGHISLNESNIKKWIQLKNSNLSENHSEEITDVKNLKSQRISPLPFDIDKDIILDESDQGSSSDEEIKPEKGHVRFSEKVQVNEVESDTESVSSSETETVETGKTSTPNQRLEFEKFKAELFSSTQESAADDSTLIEQSRIIEERKRELIDKTELLKIRLLELEKEISSFKQHNADLIKLKQEHELERVRLQQEVEEKLNDERIKIEIILHDERIKLEEEKRKYEKLLKDQKVPNRREREEITKLKEQVELLQKENKNKDSKHVAAQARLRAQIRNLEKEMKELNFEMDALRKENKKLEAENTKLHRLNNQKILHEINKTISKLAPKTENSTTEVQNRNTKTVVAKVVSCKKHEPKRVGKSVSVPDLSRDEESSITSSDQESDSTSAIDRSTISNIKENTSIEHNVEKINSSKGIYKDGLKREIINSDGSKDIWYINGNLKKISADGMVIRMLYYNKDIKETNITEGTVKYYYAETNTWHTTYLDGLEILEFPNGQTEHRYKDGTIEVHFPNGSIRISNPTDESKLEEWRYPDGTTLVQMRNGERVLSLANGQKEIHTKSHRRREYPDGTVKIVYPDGSQETRYSNGRVRLKDKDGILVMDSGNLKC